MRIAILTVVFSKEYGVTRVINAQLPYLVDAGYEIDLYSCESIGLNRIDGVRYIRIPTHLKFVKQALNSGNYNLVIAHTQPFYPLLPLLNPSCKTILYQHGAPPIDFFPIEERELRIREISSLVERVYPFVTQVVTISNFSAAHIKWPEARVIYNGADHYLGLSVIEQRPSDALRVLCISRYGKGEQCYKGLDDLARLQKELGQNVKVVLVGRGPEEEKVKLEKNGLTVIDYVDDYQLVQEFKKCDVLVSFSKFESFNLPLAEAGFFAKPAVALNIGPHNEVTPFVFDDYEGVKKYLSTSNRDTFRVDGLKMYSFVREKFEWKRNACELIHLIKEIVEEPIYERRGLFCEILYAYWTFREYVRKLLKRKR